MTTARHPASWLITLGVIALPPLLTTTCTPAPSRIPRTSAAARSLPPSASSSPPARPQPVASSTVPTRSPQPAASSHSPQAPPLLTAPSAFADLPVDGFRDAVVSLPLGSRGLRPVVVAVHGNYDTPSWQCEVWRGIVADQAFVLCPRGDPRGDSPARDDIRYTYVGASRLEREVRAGLRALSGRYPDRVQVTEVTFAGFSLGAILGAPMVLSHGEQFTRAVFIEGGIRAITRAGARKWAKSGGQRVVLACGQWVCSQRAARAKRLLEAEGVRVDVVNAKGEGHTYGGQVSVGIFEVFERGWWSK